MYSNSAEKLKEPSCSSSKSAKRAISEVSPCSPQITISDMRQLLDEKLAPVYEDIHSLRETVVSNAAEWKLELESVIKSIDSVNQKLESVRELVNEKTVSIESEIYKLKLKQEKAEDEISTLTDRIISLEGHMRRDNLKLLNVRQQNSGGQSENCENLVISLFNDLNIDLDERSIVRAHRSGPRGKVNQPIIIKFHHFKDKLKVLKAKKRLSEIGIIVVEDFPSEVLERRRKFRHILQAAYKSNGAYKARLVVDKILINGKLYSSDEIALIPKELQLSNNCTITKGRITAIYTSDSPLSNHHPAHFTVGNREFKSAEQYLMYHKAAHFQDKNTAEQILLTSDPKKAKLLGKSVQNFNMKEWRSVCDSIMESAITAKFQQNQDLRLFLKQTGDTKLAEANPYDEYWGVGISLHNEDIWDTSKWKGRNVLGKLLEKLRSTL